MNKRALRSFATCAFVAMFFASGKFAQAQDYSFWWHNILTQTGRNASIVNETRKYWNCQYVDVECKPWVQNVVWGASKKVVWLPQNDPYCDWRWVWSPNVEVVASDRWSSIPMAPGLIIQAQVKYSRWPYTSPHTMIVTSANASSITVVEANYGAGNALRVNRRTISWAAFKANVLHYTLYRVK